MTPPFDAILGLGSNIGDKAANIAAAIATLGETGGIRVVARSRLYRTPPWGVTDQDWFANACIGVATSLGPRALLQECQDIERRMKRVRKERWGPRIIDIDILVMGSRVVAEPDLIIPHPRIAERAFVLAPLADIAPNLMLGGRSVRQRLSTIDTEGVVPIAASA